jgi:hypothetical protein
MQKKKLTKLNINCDLRCLAKCEKLFEELEAKYGVVKYDYGNKHNLHGKNMTEHHKIPQACGGGNEAANQVYANRPEHDVIHEIYDIKNCREHFLNGGKKDAEEDQIAK